MPEGVATSDFMVSGGVLPEGYGMVQFGAPWAEAEGVLILVHGRDRDPQDLPISAIRLERTRRRRVLAPFIASRSWYPGRYDAPIAVNLAGIDAAIDLIVQAFAVAKAHGHGPDNVVLAGFSQGGCVAAHYLVSGNELPAAAAIFTGSLPDIANRQTEEGLVDLLPVTVSGGVSDPWLPVEDLRATAAFLARAGADVRMEEYQDADHVVRPAEIALLDALLEKIAA